MNIPQIRLESTFAKIGIRTEKPIQRIEQPKPEVTIEQPKAEMTVKTTPGKLTIDQLQAWSDLGFKPTALLVKEFAAEGKQAELEGIARRTRQGNELMRIENKVNPLPKQAEENAYKPQKRLAISWIPSPGSVQLHYELAKVDIEVTLRKPVIEARVKKPVHEYIPGKVHIYLEKRNSLKIDFNSSFNETV